MRLAADPRGTIGGPNNGRIPGNRIQAKTAEARVYAEIADDCSAEGRGFASHQPLAFEKTCGSRVPTFRSCFRRRANRYSTDMSNEKVRNLEQLTAAYQAFSETGEIVGGHLAPDFEMQQAS